MTSRYCLHFQCAGNYATNFKEQKSGSNYSSVTFQPYNCGQIFKTQCFLFYIPLVYSKYTVEAKAARESRMMTLQQAADHLTEWLVLTQKMRLVGFHSWVISVSCLTSLLLWHPLCIGLLLKIASKLLGKNYRGFRLYCPQVLRVKGHLGDYV